MASRAVRALALCCPALAPLGDVFVDIGDPGCKSGTGGADDPFCSIGAAIAAASPGDTIHIAPGTYLEQNLVIAKSLTLIGTEGDAVTIVDASKSGRVLQVGPIAVQLIGLTLTNGATGSEGGAISSFGFLTLKSSTVSGSSSGDRGGGIYSGYGSLTLNSSTISGNQTSGRGGGIYVYAADLRLSSCTVAGNQAYDGGGIAAHRYYGSQFAGAVIVQDSLLTKNTAYAQGGAAHLDGSGSLFLSSSTVSGNTAGALGGGLYLGPGYQYAPPASSVSGCTVDGNEAGDGGGIASREHELALTNTTVSGNLASGTGGGLYSYAYARRTTLASCTVTANEASYAGGLAAYGAAEYATVEAGNSVVARNVDNADNDLGGAFSSLGGNLIGELGDAVGFADGVAGDQVGTSENPVDPLLGPLQDNGGPTSTHALLVGSPALDAAISALCPPEDQRGVPRPQGLACDIGSFELDEAPECFLILGRQPLDVPLPFSPTDIVYALPELVFPIVGSAPVFPIPDDPALLGVHLFSQVYMHNPLLDPDDPYKLSNGVDITLGLGGASFGASSGLTLWIEAPLLGGALVHGFVVDG